MQTIDSYLNDLIWNRRLKKKDLAHILGVSGGALTHYLKGEDVPDDEKCLRLAEFSGDDPKAVLIMAQASRAKQGKASLLWADIYETFKKASNFMIGAAVVLGACLLASPAEAEAAVTFASGAGSSLLSFLVRIVVVVSIHYATWKEKVTNFLSSLVPSYSFSYSH